MPEEIRREESNVPRASIYEERRAEGRGGEFRGEGRGFLSWSAVWSGVMGAIGMEILFVLFGLFIYFVMFNPQAPGTGGANIWAAIWFFVTSFVALYFGGWVASKCAGSTTRRNGVMHGWVTWGVATLGAWVLGIMALTPVMTTLGNIASGAVAAAPQAAAQIPGQATQQAQQMLGQVNPQQVLGGITGNLALLFLWLFIGTGLGFIGSWLGGAKGASGISARGAEAVPPGGRLAA